MECESSRRLLPAYGDNELGVESALEVERHLQGCAGCRTILEHQRAFSAAIGRLYPRAPLPPGMEDRLSAAWRSAPGRRPWVGLLALAASAVLVLTGLWSLVRPNAPATPPGVLAATEIHRHASRQEVSLAIHSSDVAAVNTWLAAALPFPLNQPVQKTNDMALQGAATVDLAGERAGYVQYRRDGQLVSLFLLPPREWPPHAGKKMRFRGIDFHLFTIDGVNAIAWNHAPLSYVLVSGLGAHGGQACAACHSSTTDSALLGFAGDGNI